MSATEQRVEAVERALSILEAFSIDRKQMSLKEIAAETGLYKSTILRLAASLERYGYLSRKPDGQFSIGASAWRLGSLYRRSFDFGEHIRPGLRHLVDVTKETASYYVREDDCRVCLYRENSRESLRHHLDEGARLPLDRGAAAHVLRIFDAPRNPDVVERFSALGYTETEGERSPHVAAIAAPIFNGRSRLRGSLTISGPLTRFTAEARKAASEPLIAAAKRLSQKLSEAERP